MDAFTAAIEAERLAERGRRERALLAVGTPSHQVAAVLAAYDSTHPSWTSFVPAPVVQSPPWQAAHEMVTGAWTL